MEEKKQKVINWIRSGMNYNEGISLIIELSGKQFYGNPFIGKERRMSEKLAYEICRVAQVADFTTWREFVETAKLVEGEPMADSNELTGDGTGEILPIFNTGIANAKKNSEASASANDINESIASKPLTEYPAIIRRIIYEYAEFFQERSRLHAALAGMPESNADSVCAKRAEILDVIKSLSERLELLYITKKAFDEKGIIPEEKDIFPPIKKDDPKPAIDEAGLKKQKKNLQSGNSKDQTMLDYQAKEKKDLKNPMPEGLKRRKIEMRIQERNKEIEKIEGLLLECIGAK